MIFAKCSGCNTSFEIVGNGKYMSLWRRFCRPKKSLTLFIKDFDCPKCSPVQSTEKLNLELNKMWSDYVHDALAENVETDNFVNDLRKLAKKENDKLSGNTSRQRLYLSLKEL